MMQKPIGHDKVKSLLPKLNAHTLLFAGPQRVGRRQIARWYASLLNCQQSDEGPCGKCPSCQAMAANSHPDYRELSPEAVTKTGRVSRRPQIRIDDLVPRPGGQAEPLSRWLEMRPQFKRRIAVIDQAETINEQAANAFLKFLEEPPSYAVIILIAPSAQAVLPTVASRSTIIRFATVDVTELAPLEIEHPAARLGKAGDLIEASAQVEVFRELLSLLDNYLQGLSKGLEVALEQADALEKRWSAEENFDIAELLRARLSQLPAGAYLNAVNAVERCETALAAYASPALAMQLLTLELREILKKTQN